ncbi:MAG: sulfatase [Pirellulales bacterium]|jgi:arylsulfatase A
MQNVKMSVTLRVVLMAFSVLAASVSLAAERLPNVVLILIDDMGWRDVGFMGNAFVETPHIDRLAREGLVFQQAYASAPNCAPTRACLMSGQLPPRHGIYTVVDPRQPQGAPWHKLLAADSKPELSTEVVTIPEALAPAGYRSGFFGMWNLGRGRTGPRTPGGQGFDHVVFPENLGFGKDAYFDDQGRHLSDRLTDEILSFVEESQQRPFFVYYADHAVHAPFEPEQELLAKYQQKAAAGSDRRNDPAYAATIEAVDRNVGRIMDALTAHGIAEDTLVIFTSDNGGTASYTPPLAGGKGQLLEGGIRVPLAMWWPGTIKPAQTTAEPVASIDFYPTLVELAGLVSPQPLDGLSLVPLLRDGSARLPQRPLFWHFPCYIGKSTPSSAMRQGDFKLIEYFEDGGRVELYNLRDDPSESEDLAKAQPDTTAALARILRNWQASTGAAIPDQSNPAYDPSAKQPRGRQQGQDGQPRGRQQGQQKQPGRKQGQEKD